MKITREHLKNIVKETMIEESEYQEFFKKALEKAGKSIPSMSDDEKKAFFNKIEKTWNGRGKKNEGNAFGAAVAKAKKDGDSKFKVGDKEYKVERFGRGDETELDELTKAQEKLPPALKKAIEKKEGKKESVEESVNELSDKDIKKAEQIRKSMPGFVGEKFAKKASNEDILAFADLQDKEAQIYNSKIKPIRDAKKKLYKKYRIRESVNEGSMSWEKHFKGYNEKELQFIQKLIWLNPQDIDGVIKMSKKKDFKPFVQKAAKKGLHESINEGPSTEEKRIAMLAVRKQAKYRNVSLEQAIQDQINALEELKRDAKRGKIK